jgi:hypothetical protein
MTSKGDKTMTTTETVKLNKLILTAEEDDGSTYDFEAYELPTGECVVHYEGSHDAWWPTRNDIEANGTAFVVEVKDDNKSIEWTRTILSRSVSGSAREYALESVPESLHKYVLPALKGK